GRGARPPAESFLQRDPRPRLLGNASSDAPRPASGARVCRSRGGAVRSVRVRVLRRLGAGTRRRGGGTAVSPGRRAHARRPYFLSPLAETYSLAGNRDRANAILDTAIAMNLQRGDVWWLPALYLQKAEI